MLSIKSKKMALLLSVCLISGLVLPELTLAESVNSWGGDSGSIDAGKAATQRAAIAKRKERIKQEKEAEAKKAAEAQQGQPAEEKKETPATQ
jgi:hypothetical protein